MPGAGWVRSADSLLRPCRAPCRGRACGANVPFAGRQRFENRVEMLAPWPSRRRSSGSSRAQVPTRRRWCPHRHNECPWLQSPRRGGYRRCSANCRHRSRCRLFRAAGAVRSSVLSTTAAGTIIHDTRGFQFLTKSSMDAAPVAPSAPSFFTLSGLISKTTHWWPRAHQALHHVGAHSAEADHSQLHWKFSLRQVVARLDYSTPPSPMTPVYFGNPRPPAEKVTAI